MIYGFFILGFLSAIAFRSLLVIQRMEPSWVRPVWYTGVLGYIGFFLYRFAITRKRKQVITEYHLIDKIQASTCLSSNDRDVITYLLSSISKSREDLNYLIIFLMSFIAIAVDLILSLLA